MHRLFKKPLPFLALLCALLHRARGAPVQELSGIGETQCLEDSTERGGTSDCQDVINHVWGLQGGVGGNSGCVEIAQKGNCALKLCETNREDTTVSYGSIAAAAQIQHAICRYGSVTGGYTLVEGMQQPGEAHSKAKVSLRYDDKDNQRHMMPNRRSSDGEFQESKPTLIARAESMYVPRSVFRVDEQFVNHNPVFDADLTNRGEGKCSILRFYIQQCKPKHE
jgi:hypothetical protein